MEVFINFFNNREKALIIWFLIVFVILISSKSFRPSILALFKAFFARKIVTVLLVMFAYIALIVFAAYNMRVWDVSLLKDTIIWVLGTAFVMFMNYDKVNTEKKYFQKVLLDNVKFVVLLEFITNFYVFNFVVEFLLVPVLFFTVALLVFTDTKPEYKPVKNLLQILLGIYGIFLLIFAIVHIASDLKDFLTIYTLKDFLLAPLLTVLLLPFVYFLALYATYEAFFTRMDIFLRSQNKQLRRFIKWQILRTCLLSLKKLNKFGKDYNTQLMSIENKADVVRLTHQFKASSRS